MARVNRKAKKILITGMILGAAAGILLTFLAANSKMHDKNDEIKTVKAKSVSYTHLTLPTNSRV